MIKTRVIKFFKIFPPFEDGILFNYASTHAPIFLDDRLALDCYYLLACHYL